MKTRQIVLLLLLLLLFIGVGGYYFCDGDLSCGFCFDGDPSCEKTTPSEENVEVRTLSFWNMAHPYEGPKNFSEKFFGHLMHQSVVESSLAFNLPENRPLAVQGSVEDKRRLKVSLDIAQRFGYYLSQYYGFEEHGGTLIFPQIEERVLVSLLKYEPLLPEAWQQSQDYTLAQPPPTSGDYGFPKSMIASDYPLIVKRSAKGVLLFGSKRKGFRDVAVLSLFGISREDFEQIAGFGQTLEGDAKARVYLDVPWQRVKQTGAPWRHESVTTKTLKLMCPNYNNPRMRTLFAPWRFRELIQQAVDYVHSEFIQAGEGGLRRVPRDSIFSAFVSNVDVSDDATNRMATAWRQFVRASQLPGTEAWPGEDYKVGYNSDRNQTVLSRQGGLIRSNADPVFLKVHYSDYSRDRDFFIQLQQVLAELGIMNLDITREGLHTRAQMVDFLAGRESLTGEELIVLDIPLPGHHHIEAYFAEGSFLALPKALAPLTREVADRLVTGQGTTTDVAALGQALRRELPCVALGIHDYYVYSRNEGAFALPDVPSSLRVGDEPDAYVIAQRVKAAARAPRARAQ